MTYFLSEERRRKLIGDLTALGMPKDMAAKFASEPDNIGVIDVKLAAHANQAAGYRNRLSAGDRSVTNFLLANVICIIFYMEEAVNRNLEETDLPISYAAFTHHNTSWANENRNLQ